MSFRRHLMSTVRNAKRSALRDLDKIISGIPDGAADGARDAALNQLATSRWLIMSDTAGTPAATPEVVEAWIARGPERMLKDAREFLVREADLVIEHGPLGEQAFSEAVLERLSQALADATKETVHAALDTAAEGVQSDLKERLGSNDVAPPDVIVMPMRELCGLDGHPEARGPEAGSLRSALEVARAFASALEFERQAPELAEDNSPVLT